jgi:hypothetical protein
MQQVVHTTTAAIPNSANYIRYCYTNRIYHCNGDDTGAFRVDFNTSLGLAHFSLVLMALPKFKYIYRTLRQDYIVTIRDAKLY